MTALHPVGTSPPIPQPVWVRRILVATVVLLVAGLWVGGHAAAQPTQPPPPPPPGTTAPQWPPPPTTTAPVQPSQNSPSPTTPATPDTPAPGSSQAPSPTSPGDATPPIEPSDGGDSECGVRNISGCVAEAIDGFFQRLVESALSPLLDLLSHTLLTTPEPGDLPRVGELWDSSWQLMLAVYGLLVMAAGVLLMMRETLQTRYSIQDLAPRIVAGFLAGAMSLLIATQAIRFANALATAVAGDGLDPDSAGAALRELATITAVRGLVSPAAGPGIFVILLEVALVVLLVVLLITYVVRVAVTIILVVAAPLALMCHVLPGLDSVARWWWRSFAACLAIQVVQSLALVTALRVFLTPGGWGFFGPNTDGLVSLIIGLALIAVLIKVPFWLLSSMRIGPGGGRSMAGSLVRGYVTYKTFGLIKGGEKAVAAAVRRPATSPSGNTLPATGIRARGGRSGSATVVGGIDPYSRTRSTRDGQLMLPLDGVHRVRRTPAPASPQQQSAVAGTAARTTPTSNAPAVAQRRRPQGRQLAFDFTPPDPYKGTRADHRGQYPLPIPVNRVRRAQVPASAPAPAQRPSIAPASATPAPPPRSGPGTQLAFEFEPPDPYEGNRPLRSGQYRLPFPVPRVLTTSVISDSTGR